MIQYTLTGAADWPMLASVGGFGLLFFQVIVLGLIGLVWRSLPKHQDLQNLKSEINIDIKELTSVFSAVIKDLTKDFETMLDKHLAKETEDRKEMDQSISFFCERQRQKCQASNEKLFDELFEKHK